MRNSSAIASLPWALWTTKFLHAILYLIHDQVKLIMVNVIFSVEIWLQKMNSQKPVFSLLIWSNSLRYFTPLNADSGVRFNKSIDFVSTSPLLPTRSVALQCAWGTQGWCPVGDSAIGISSASFQWFKFIIFSRKNQRDYNFLCTVAYCFCQGSVAWEEARSQGLSWFCDQKKS